MRKKKPNIYLTEKEKYFNAVNKVDDIRTALSKKSSAKAVLSENSRETGKLTTEQKVTFNRDIMGQTIQSVSSLQTSGMKKG